MPHIDEKGKRTPAKSKIAKIMRSRSNTMRRKDVKESHTAYHGSYHRIWNTAGAKKKIRVWIPGSKNRST